MSQCSHTGVGAVLGELAGAVCGGDNGAVLGEGGTRDDERVGVLRRHGALSVGPRHLDVLLLGRIGTTLGWLDLSRLAVAIGRHERLGADGGKKGHQEEHRPQVRPQDGEQEEGAELGEELQRARREHGAADGRGEHPPEDRDAEGLERVVRALEARLGGARHVGVREVDDIVDGEAAQDHDREALGEAELPAHHLDRAEHRHDAHGDRQSGERRDDQVARREEQHDEGHRQPERHARDRKPLVQSLQLHEDPPVALADRLRPAVAVRVEVARHLKGDAEVGGRALVDPRHKRLPLVVELAELGGGEEAVGGDHRRGAHLEPAQLDAAASRDHLHIGEVVVRWPVRVVRRIRVVRRDRLHEADVRLVLVQVAAVVVAVAVAVAWVQYAVIVLVPCQALVRWVAAVLLAATRLSRRRRRATRRQGRRRRWAGEGRRIEVRGLSDATVLEPAEEILVERHAGVARRHVGDGAPIFEAVGEAADQRLGQG
mmetsp:Transcript_23289/g.55465  ORF Transcript_23289/g.55465 Transcript_23289/m.55465 type:complete len:487 (+) Transcript_23289:132-1592(+)